MRVNVTESEMTCILLLRQACFHNGHQHQELWTHGLRAILGRAVPIHTGPIEFNVVLEDKSPPPREIAR